MSAGYTTRLKVQGILRADINEFLSASRLTGWEVMEFAQTQMQKADGVILLNCIRSLQVGWNRDEYSTDKNDLMRTERTLEEQTWQIHVLIHYKALNHFSARTSARLSPSDDQAADQSSLYTAYPSAKSGRCLLKARSCDQNPACPHAPFAA